MIFIFEDHPNAITSKFFKQAYPDEISKNFKYAEGNTNIKQEIVSSLSTTLDEIIVFLDMIPGNSDIILEYKQLKKLSLQNQYRIIIMPIVCSEFYLIQYLNEANLITDKTGVDTALKKQFYKNSPLIKKHLQYKCNNFEHFCKIIVRENIKFCASLSTTIAKNYYNWFYTQDCLCKVKENSCITTVDKINKSIDFISKYPCVPSGSYAKRFELLTVNQIWDKHRKLVNEFNDMVNNYKLADPSNAKKYISIKEIK